jgi:two-component system, LytTR family, sensor kinase
VEEGEKSFGCCQMRLSARKGRHSSRFLPGLSRLFSKSSQSTSGNGSGGLVSSGNGPHISLFEFSRLQVILKSWMTSSTDAWIKRRLIPLGIVLGLWCGLVTLFTIQAVVVNSMPWAGALAQIRSFWLLWIFFLPVIVWLSFKFPLERPQILLQIGIHLAACIAIVVLDQVATRTFLPSPLPPFGSRPFARFADGSPPAMRSRGMRVAPDLLIYVVTMSASVAFAHYRKSQERERRAIELEARLAQAKLQALRMQINPHFLFNTLNAISTLVHTSPHTADDMITDLSELFRASLESSDDQEIPLARELELLQRYLSIEQRRFGTRLQVEQAIAPETLDALVPTLILQPSVENAIRHGIEPQAEIGKIAIRAWRDGGKLKLSVSDNGKKPVAFSLADKSPERPGVGLTNTHARLQQLYGDHQAVTIGKGELGGWTVEIEMPFHRASAKSVTL